MTKSLDLPERLSLARLPTPVEPLLALSAELGVRLLIKRDDLTGMPLSGNKIRKLEFSLAEARRQAATAVITTGGVQSNHCRATAIAALRIGMKPHLLLRTAEGEPPSVFDGNYLLAKLVGARIRHITPEAYIDRDSLMEQWADELSASGERPFVIPEGASDALGALGYVAMAYELVEQRDAGTLPSGVTEIDHVVHACGSGGTAAGLAIGAQLNGLDARITAYAVCDDVPTFEERIGSIIADVVDRFIETGTTLQPDLEVVDDYKGIGYAISTTEELAFIRDVARSQAILLDPVYTGKAMRGLVEDLREGRRYSPGSTILFVHTGGLFGLFPKRTEIPL